MVVARSVHLVGMDTRVQGDDLRIGVTSGCDETFGIKLILSVK